MTKKHIKVPTILIVDDTPANVELLVAILSLEYTVKTASRGSEALAAAREMQPDMIMLDIMMPGMNGFDVCRALKADVATKGIPVIFVTSLLKPDDEALGFEVGGVDYITKPFSALVVRTRVKTHLALKGTQIELEGQNEELCRSQKELELSRNTYAGLFDFAPVGYFTFDARGHIQEANLAGAELIGIERRQLVDIPFSIFITDAEGREVFSKHLESVLLRQGMHKCEIRLTRKDGAVVYGVLQSVTVDAIEGRDGYILSSVEDCTVAKQLATKIQEAREYAENIIETVRKPLVVLNSGLIILTANNCFYDTFKVTPEETIGNYICDLGNRQWDIPKLRALFDDILLNHTVFNDYEVEHDFQGIGRKTILLNAREIFREKIGSHIILLAMEDITKRKQLHEEQSRLAMIVESSNDAIFTVSPNDVITSWNEGAESIFGYTAGEIIGKQIFTIIPAELHHERTHIWQTILSGEHLKYFETTRIRKDSKRIYVSLTTSPLLNTDGEIIGNSVIARDVTERRKMEETIKHQALHDTLTDLPNRQLFMDLLALELAQSHRHSKKMALMFLDLNGFKQVNDSYGHDCGDRLLQEVARRLKASIRESDTVARFGGDEFTVLMSDLAWTDDVGIVLKKIMGAFEAPFILDGVTVETSTSIGVSMFPEDGTCGEDLMKKADSAMYEAKGAAGNSYQFYTTNINTPTIAEATKYDRYRV
jgi:diguanylate cyclase (GGDEF)-like protein/PAS domain S-box-containing protein